MKLSEREQSVTKFALRMFSSHARAHAEAAAQEKKPIFYKQGDAAKFLDDAKCAEGILEKMK